MIQTQALKSGKMSIGEATYEQFESLLASYCLTYQHLKDSSIKSKRQQYERIIAILNSLAERHGVQLPEDAIENPRCNDAKWLPQKMTYQVLHHRIFDFYRIFHIDKQGSNENDLIRLHSVLHQADMKL